MATKKVVATLDQMSISTEGFIEPDPKDDLVFTPGDTLEVIGRIGIGRLDGALDSTDAPQAPANLFDRTAVNAQSVMKGSSVSIDNQSELNLSPGEILQLSGQLGGRDGAGDFEYGQPFELRFPFDIVSPDVLHLGPFNVSGIPVKVKISVSVTPE